MKCKVCNEESAREYCSMNCFRQRTIVNEAQSNNGHFHNLNLKLDKIIELLENIRRISEKQN